MADVTISSLPLGTPSSSALLPYSQGGSTLAVAPSGIVAASPGCLLQIKQSVKTDIQSLQTSTFTDITNLSVSITPKVQTSSFFITAMISSEHTQSNAPVFRLMRDDTPIGVGNVTGRTNIAATTWVYAQAPGGLFTVPLSYLDTPTLSNLNPITYKVQARCNNLSPTEKIFFNSNYDDPDSPTQARCISTFIIQEIAG